MADHIIASPSDIEAVVLCAYWEYYHFVPLWEIDKIPNLKEMSEADIITGLSVFENQEKTVSVEAVTQIEPLLVYVDDLGVFKAVYDKTEEMAIRSSTSSRKAAQIKFTDSKWNVDVFEIFRTIPAIVVSDSANYRFISTQEEASPYRQNSRYVIYPKTSQSPYVYPCSVYVHKELTDGKSKVTVRDFDYYDGVGYGGYGYWDGDHYVQHSPTVQTQRDIKYFWDNRVQGKSMCGYDSTKEYVESLLGVVLHLTDREWYEKNDKVELNGLPIKHTLSVLTELVAPYDIEINKVWVRELVWEDEFTQFASRLGVDGEVREMLIKRGAVLPPPRFFTGVEPVGPCIVMSKSTTTAFPGGHAQYIAPRQTIPGDWIMAISYRRIP